MQMKLIKTNRSWMLWEPTSVVKELTPTRAANCKQRKNRSRSYCLWIITFHSTYQSACKLIRKIRLEMREFIDQLKSGEVSHKTKSARDLSQQLAIIRKKIQGQAWKRNSTAGVSIQRFIEIKRLWLLRDAVNFNANSLRDFFWALFFL